MRFIIRFNGCDVVVEAESGVHAVIKMIDVLSNTTDNLEFQITGFHNNPYYQDM